LNRRRYEQGHWDSVIQKYREIELLDEEADSLKSFLQPIRQLLERNHSSTYSANVLHGNAIGDHHSPDSSLLFSGSWLPCHAIDLHPSGALNAHVDSVRFSGNIVAGLSLLSDSIMRLKPSDNCDAVTRKATADATDTPETIQTDFNKGYIDLWLPTRSLYVLSGRSRYSYTHELLPSGSLFRNETSVNRDRRLSIIFRDAKNPNVPQEQDV
jgi:alkylated DNA repair protein alkB homolog 7